MAVKVASYQVGALGNCGGQIYLDQIHEKVALLHVLPEAFPLV